MPFRLIPIRAKGPIQDRRKLMSGFTKALVDQKADGVRYMAEYPPQRAGSRYRRTGGLKRSWHSVTPIVRTADSISTVIASQGQIAPYNRKVQGADQDPLFAAGGWRDVDMLARRTQQQLPKRAQDELNRATR